MQPSTAGPLRSSRSVAGSTGARSRGSSLSSSCRRVSVGLGAVGGGAGSVGGASSSSANARTRTASTARPSRASIIALSIGSRYPCICGGAPSGDDAERRGKAAISSSITRRAAGPPRSTAAILSATPSALYSHRRGKTCSAREASAPRVSATSYSARTSVFSAAVRDGLGIHLGPLGCGMRMMRTYSARVTTNPRGSCVARASSPSCLWSARAEPCGSGRKSPLRSSAWGPGSSGLARPATSGFASLALLAGAGLVPAGSPPEGRGAGLSAASAWSASIAVAPRITSAAWGCSLWTGVAAPAAPAAPAPPVRVALCEFEAGAAAAPAPSPAFSSSHEASPASESALPSPPNPGRSKAQCLQPAPFRNCSTLLLPPHLCHTKAGRSPGLHTISGTPSWQLLRHRCRHCCTVLRVWHVEHVTMVVNGAVPVPVRRRLPAAPAAGSPAAPPVSLRGRFAVSSPTPPMPGMYTRNSGGDGPRVTRTTRRCVAAAGSRVVSATRAASAFAGRPGRTKMRPSQRRAKLGTGGGVGACPCPPSPPVVQQ